jgi:hypothetical protein
MGVWLNDGDTDSDGFPNWAQSYEDAISSEGIVFGQLRTGNPRDAVLASTQSFGSLFDNRAAVQLGGVTSGTFDLVPPGYPLTTLVSPFRLDLGKLSPDQSNDVVIACREGRPPGGCQFIDEKGGVAVLTGKPDGTFHSTIRYFATEVSCQSPPRLPRPTFVRIGDLNNDGRNDIVAANNTSKSIGVLINNTQVSP